MHKPQARLILLLSAILLNCPLLWAAEDKRPASQQAESLPAEQGAQSGADASTAAENRRMPAIAEQGAASAIAPAQSSANSSPEQQKPLQTAAEQNLPAAGICPVVDGLVTDFCQQQPDDIYCKTLQ